jgi:chromate reductase, NAD(P)H dehydrogenase (quinone)
MRILLLAASLRVDSLNKKLAQVINKILLMLGYDVDFKEFAIFNAPQYNGDDETTIGLPAETLQFIENLKAAQGLIIVSPEYNFATPGILKNLLDWTSRAKPMPLANYPIMLASASPSMVGGSRGLLQTLLTLQAACTAQVFAKMFTLAMADKAFNEYGDLLDTTLHEQLVNNVKQFITFINKS